MSAAAPHQLFEIPGYRLLRKLGEGGAATVYLALQSTTGHQVAIKVLTTKHMPSEEQVKRFEQEAQLIARLDHPHIVRIHEIGRTSGGQLYYSMPFLPNGDLSTRHWVDEQPRIVTTMTAICQALAHAHTQGIVHRDVKPENVLFDANDRPLLADFGIALAMAHGGVRLTREGITLGSASYMSPEQARRQAVDGRSDLYSLGVLCYELVVGDLPFHGPTAIAVALAHAEDAVPRLPPMRRHWQALIDKALAKEPDARFRNAAEFITALEQIQAHLDGRIETMNSPSRLASMARNLAIAIALLATVAFAAWWLLHAPAPTVDAEPSSISSAASAPILRNILCCSPEA